MYEVTSTDTGYGFDAVLRFNGTVIAESDVSLKNERAVEKWAHTEAAIHKARITPETRVQRSFDKSFAL